MIVQTEQAPLPKAYEERQLNEVIIQTVEAPLLKAYEERQLTEVIVQTESVRPAEVSQKHTEVRVQA